MNAVWGDAAFLSDQDPKPKGCHLREPRLVFEAPCICDAVLIIRLVQLSSGRQGPFCLSCNHHRFFAFCVGLSRAKGCLSSQMEWGLVFLWESTGRWLNLFSFAIQVGNESSLPELGTECVNSYSASWKSPLCQNSLWDVFRGNNGINVRRWQTRRLASALLCSPQPWLHLHTQLSSPVTQFRGDASPSRFLSYSLNLSSPFSSSC